VRLVAARVTPVRLRLREPLDTAHGVIRARTGAVLELEDAAGRRGFGEALPLPGFGLESAEQATRSLETLASESLAAGDASLEQRLDDAETRHPEAPSARGALDAALHDLAARGDGLPLAVWLAKRAGGRARPAVATGRLLAATDPEAAAREALRARDAGHGTLKLKVGAADLDREVARAARVREAVGPEPYLRLDANGAWSEPVALEAVARLAPLGIELLEQPVPADATAALARVHEAAPFPIAADESVRDVASAEALLAAGVADVLVIKPAALGGLRACRRIAARATDAGVPLVVTSFLDSALGVSQALHLAAALPGERHAAGLATADRIVDDPCAAPVLRDGALQVPAGPGLGCRPDPERLARVAAGPARELTG